MDFPSSDSWVNGVLHKVSSISNFPGSKPPTLVTHKGLDLKSELYLRSECKESGQTPQIPLSEISGGHQRLNADVG